MEAINERRNEPGDKTWNVTVNSIGNAGISMISALRKVLPLSEQEIAARLLQAPSPLAENLSQSVAEQMSKLLIHAGLDVEMVPANEEIISGKGDCEISLCIQDFNRINEVIHLAIEVTGVDVTQAIRMINSVPTVFLSNISENNVRALAERFQKLGVNIDVSRPQKALYDVFVHNESHRVQQEFLSLARSLNIEQIVCDEKARTTSLVGLPFSAAQAVWQSASDKRIQCRMLNRDYQRYDVRLESLNTNHRDAVTEVLSQDCGIPEKVLPNLYTHLPITIASNIPLAQAQNLIARLHEHQAIAVAELTAGLSFNIGIEDINEAEKVQKILENIGSVSKNKILEIIKGKVKRLDANFTYNQARWLVAELRKLKCKVNMVRR